MEIKLAKVLGKRLAGMTYGEIERATGIPKSLLSDWKNGATPRNLVQLKALSEYLDCTLDELLFDSVTEEKKILSSTVFSDEENGTQYKILIEKLSRKSRK